MDDSRLLYDWRTDPVTVSMSDQPPPASYEAHEAWLARRLAHQSPHLSIAEHGGAPVGTVRLDAVGEAFDVGITIALERRGEGFAAAALLALEAVAPGPLIARIKPENVASVAAFLHAGFTVTGQTAAHHLLTWDHPRTLAGP